MSESILKCKRHNFVSLVIASKASCVFTLCSLDCVHVPLKTDNLISRVLSQRAEFKAFDNFESDSPPRKDLYSRDDSMTANT